MYDTRAFKMCHGSLYAVMWLADEPREFNLPTLPQRCITCEAEKLPSKYGVHSEEYVPIRSVYKTVAAIYRSDAESRKRKDYAISEEVYKTTAAIYRSDGESRKRKDYAISEAVFGDINCTLRSWQSFRQPDCNQTETLGHVLGFCRKEELLRNNRHHRVRGAIACILRNKWSAVDFGKMSQIVEFV
ncbi:hypothetical protein ANN_20400 [Periplaneta americana]|uniref:Uncharacterized protein n=1 Tax=Periplaneta americana TaxID=6978 RepID=A0ABQ8SDA9_PERAM|nr:hypothetical protein ANN_20400 [Periplaneta americana]